ncbi:hypothetical protein GCM10022402_45920 [Salinactinospora qingdaonensis]|uniref:Uncharacterized protein n=1 Tax=Salinactinospora qingdaonensis TaxID=702744 RepID=A0ABP7GFS4_9ACTN
MPLGQHCPSGDERALPNRGCPAKKTPSCGDGAALAVARKKRRRGGGWTVVKRGLKHIHDTSAPPKYGPSTGQDSAWNYPGAPLGKVQPSRATDTGLTWNARTVAGTLRQETTSASQQGFGGLLPVSGGLFQG